LSVAQTYNISNTTVTTCSGTFYDSGGSAGPYAVNENYTFTICPSTLGQVVKVTFTAFKTQSVNDIMTIYDGNSTTAAIWAQMSGTVGGLPISYTASVDNASGCLTFKFVSDATAGTNANSSGWTATISCTAATATLPNNQDCANKKPLCGTTTLTDNSNGIGYVSDITAANGGCFTASATAETQSSWYSFSMANNGTFNFVISPQNGSDDDDWILWGPNSACPPTTGPIRCTTMCYGSVINCSGNSAPSANTGMNATSIDVSETSSAGDGFVKQMNVLAGENYILMVNNASSSNSGFNISFGGTAALQSCAAVALPVELLNFTAKAERNNVRLEWKTASEMNSAYFIIERSSDGVVFEAIDQPVKAAGNSNTLRLYAHFDQLPLPGTNYYRLKQVDFDGNFKLSAIQAVVSNAMAVRVTGISPNPVSTQTENFDVNFNCGVSNLDVQLSLTNMLGQTVYDSKISMSQGFNKLSVPASTLGLQAGLYILKVTSDYQTISYKVSVY
jgi:hypothetical protein